MSLRSGSPGSTMGGAGVSPPRLRQLTGTYTGSVLHLPTTKKGPAESHAIHVLVETPGIGTGAYNSQ
nr:hypothetical protein MACL_00003033 [Theileria orientalis]